MSDLRMILASNIKNIGKRITPRKLVIIECDDWGSNRMPSSAAYDSLLAKGLISSKSHYSFDTIERGEDIELLFETLNSVKDRNGHGAVMTPFVNPANPDFEKIAEHGFTKYFYEDFTETLNRYGEKERVLNLWGQGIEQGIFIPAYHAREHLCVPLWMESLKNDNKDVKEGFASHFFSVNAKGLPAEATSFRPSLYFNTPEQCNFIKDSLIDGIRLMKQILPSQPVVFCPPNGISHSEFDQALSTEGIKAIVVNRNRKEPNGKRGIELQKYNYGQLNKWGQAYYYRNCCFEPIASGNAIDVCLTQVAAAFRWNKPAVISTHRVNFTGAINPAMRDKALASLKKLLHTIQKKWPDVEFVSSNELALLLHKER